MPKSTNPFAALDDSDDEAPTSKPPPAPKKNKIVAPSSKPDPKSKPKNNDRNTKHGRGGRPPVRDGKRAYDRRSGTGRGKEIKKGGGGARNWGSDKNEAKKMEGRINENEELAMAVDGNDAEAPTEEVEPPKEDNTMTYAEYMASKGKKEETSLRETKNEFEGINAAAKEEEESFISMGRGKKKKDKKKKEVEKKTVDVGFRVAKNNSDGGRGEGRGRGRGDRRDGRGRGRGGRGGRGAPREPRSGGAKKPQGLNVQDEGSFPSL